MYMMFERGTSKINFRRCIPYDKDGFAFFINKNLAAIITNVHNDNSSFKLQEEMYKISKEYESIQEVLKEKPTLVDRAFRRWGQGYLEKTASAVFQLPSLLANYFDYGITDSLFFDEAELEYVESKFSLNNYRALCHIMYVDVLGQFTFIDMEELYEVERMSKNRPLLKEMLKIDSDGNESDVNLDLITFHSVATYMAENDIYRLMGMDEIQEHLRDKRAYNIQKERSTEEAKMISGALALNEVLPYFAKYPGLESVETAEVLERLYRSYAKNLHPDKNNGEGEDKYKEFEDDFNLLRKSAWIKLVEEDFYKKNEFVECELAREPFTLEFTEEDMEEFAQICTVALSRTMIKELTYAHVITEEQEQELLSKAITIEYDPVFDYGVSKTELLKRYLKENADGA